MGDYFDTVLLPRIKKVTFTPEWKNGKPERLATPEEAERSPRIVKVVRLESYEDALNNLETRRSDTQQLLLGAAEAQGADGLKEQYILRYLLDVETRHHGDLYRLASLNSAGIALAAGSDAPSWKVLKTTAAQGTSIRRRCLSIRQRASSLARPPPSVTVNPMPKGSITCRPSPSESVMEAGRSS